MAVKPGTMFINGVPIVNTSIVRRIIQLTCDLARQPLAGLRILDLACAHGEYAIELATRGAEVVGIEGRDEWLQFARNRQREFGLTNVEFIHDDVRNLNKERYGEFDIVLCLGVLYHLDAPDGFELLSRIADVCRGFSIVETHVAMRADESREWRGRRYWGHPFVEHQPGTTPEQKLKAMGASLDNDLSFWITQPSLCNALRHVGFTTVSDCRNPVAYVLVGEQEEVKMWGNRVTLAAIKGQPVTLAVMPGVTSESDIDWPEDSGPYRLEDVIYTLGT